MRKKKIGMYIGVLLAIVIIIFYVWNTSTLLAEMHKSVKQTGMIASKVGFILDDKDEVKISVKSSVTEGNALITLQTL